MKKKLVKMKLTIIAVGILMLALTGCAQKEDQKITVVLDWVPNTNHTGLYVAQQLGYFKEEGLDVEIIQPSEGGSADLIAAGQGDFGISYQEQVTYARTAANPLPIKAIAAIIQHNTSGFASPADRNIVSPKNFEGKKYGGWGSPMEVATLKGLMEADNANFNQLEIVDVGALDFFTAVKEHVDFTWIFYGWDGVSAELQNYPINFIRLQDVDKNLDYYTPVIIANEEYLKKNPETAKKFLRAASKGYQYAIDNPEAAADLLLVDNPEINRDLAVASQKYLAGEYQSDAAKWGVMKSGIWENYGKWMYDHGLLENQLNADEAFTNEYLPE